MNFHFFVCVKFQFLSCFCRFSPNKSHEYCRNISPIVSESLPVWPCRWPLKFPLFLEVEHSDGPEFCDDFFAFFLFPFFDEWLFKAFLYICRDTSIHFTHKMVVFCSQPKEVLTLDHADANQIMNTAGPHSHGAGVIWSWLSCRGIERVSLL